jgi:hypothetical protein
LSTLAFSAIRDFVSSKVLPGLAVQKDAPQFAWFLGVMAFLDSARLLALRDLPRLMRFSRFDHHHVAASDFFGKAVGGFFDEGGGRALGDAALLRVTERLKTLYTKHLTKNSRPGYSMRTDGKARYAGAARKSERIKK